MNSKYFLMIVLVLITHHAVVAQNNEYYYENAVFDENIKTVMMYRFGFELSNPVIQLGEDAQLVFKFDDLSAEPRDYYYTLIHCDANWNESFLAQTDYIDGYPENPLNDYELSFNTTFDYANYSLMIPNENVRFTVSGNYVLVVYEDNDKEKIVVTQRFHVYENLTEINGTVRRATFDAFQGSNQEVDFMVNTSRMAIQDPGSEVKAVIMQNGRWDNAVKNLNPLYINERQLSFDYNKENVFPAGNEFRYFDNRTNRYNGENVISTDFHDPYYHKTLKVDEIRVNKSYFQYQDMNGKFTVESQDQQVSDFDTESDYTFVHFTLPLEAPLLGGNVNVFGALSGWNANKSNEMTWNFDSGAYELSLLLKQGYYNYQYAYVPNGSVVADLQNIEGSFWEAENDYQIFIYYRDMAGRYDRLVGYTVLNSLTNRN
ncbi:MAG: DUF5103 domain-containing protein [Prolixibacteraceae bacterium]|nr:DUF5103 domain-containing protein [Prolixibacteraceae bacterium]